MAEYTTRELIERVADPRIHGDGTAERVANEFENPVRHNPEANMRLISMGVHVGLTPVALQILLNNGDTELSISGNAEPLTQDDLEVILTDDSSRAYVIGTFHAEAAEDGRHLVAIDGCKVTEQTGGLFHRMLECWSDEKVVSEDRTAVFNWWD